MSSSPRELVAPRSGWCEGGPSPSSNRRIALSHLVDGPDLKAIPTIERDSDGYSRVGGVMAKDFKFMGSPMTEVKRTGTAPSKRSPPIAMCRCNSAHRRIHQALISPKGPSGQRASPSSNRRKAGHESARPSLLRLSQQSHLDVRVERKRWSLSTANGGQKLPEKILEPYALMPFLTPTPASFWARTVVGTRISRTPRCAVAACKPD